MNSLVNFSRFWTLFLWDHKCDDISILKQTVSKSNAILLYLKCRKYWFRFQLEPLKVALQGSMHFLRNILFALAKYFKIIALQSIHVIKMMMTRIKREFVVSVCVWIPVEHLLYWKYIFVGNHVWTDAHVCSVYACQKINFCIVLSLSRNHNLTDKDDDEVLLKMGLMMIGVAFPWLKNGILKNYLTTCATLYDDETVFCKKRYMIFNFDAIYYSSVQIRLRGLHCWKQVNRVEYTQIAVYLKHETDPCSSKC